MQCSTVSPRTQVAGRQPFPERIAALRIDVELGAQPAQRIVMLQGSGPSPLDSPRVSSSLGARLQRDSLAVDAYDWEPQVTLPGEPDPDTSPELHHLYKEQFWSADHCEPAGMVFVRQSEGRASIALPLVSVGFQQCSALIFRNVDTAESLVMHHDSTVRSSWGGRYSVAGIVTSPSTPRRGLVGRPRCGIEEFLARPGRKRMVLVESERAYDRRELFDKFRSRGVEVLPPLVLQTRAHGGETDDARWNLAYRPLTDELMVHMDDGAASSVMQWASLLGLSRDGSGKVPLLRQTPTEDGDIVDRLPAYRAVLADPAIQMPEINRNVLRLCIEAVEQRNEVTQDGNALPMLCRQPGIPRFIRKYLTADDVRERDSMTLKGLTLLAEHMLATSARVPSMSLPSSLGMISDPDSDADSDWPSDSDSPRSETAAD